MKGWPPSATTAVKDAPKDHDFSLAPDKSFSEACTEMARKRRLTPMKRATPPPIKPWGVQFGFGKSKKSAFAKVRNQTRSCSGEVGREKIDLI